MTGQDWQSAVDSNFVRRLMRPLVQPGAIDAQLGNSILARTEQMTNHLPLLVQFAERQVGVFQPEQIPIVYAQPSSSVQVVHSHTETTTEPKQTIVQATLISNSTSNDYTSNSTNLSVSASKQNYVSNDTFNSTNLSIGRELEGLLQTGSVDAIAASNPAQSFNLSSQNLSIVYAQQISNESDRSTQTSIVHPNTSETTKLQSSIELRNLKDRPSPQVTPTRSKKPELPASSSPPIITVRTGTEAASPAATWQTRTSLNETATTLPIVFAQSNSATSSPQPTSRTPLERSQFSEVPSYTSQPFTDTTFSSPPSPPPINLDTLTTQVERKLLRRLVVESERRGQTRWR